MTSQRGAVAVAFALALFPILAAVGAAINMGELVDTRAILQRAADNAALAGAAAYAENAASFNTLAVSTATVAFCDMTASLPLGATIAVTSGAQVCVNGAGPVVSAVTDSYITGTPGVSHAQGISCTGTYLPPAPYNCGFIITVSATASIQPIIPSLFGSSASVSVTAMAANPFINFAKIFSLPNGVVSGAKYANSVWAYALSLNSAGGIDYSQNAGALPDASSCTGGPDQVTCGAYVMLASTMYAAKGIGYQPPGQSTIYDNGVVRNPVSPTAITATTPLGIAFRSIAGGNYVQFSPPGVYGYQVSNLGSSSPSYVYAPNGCIYPYNNLVYHTVGQVWNTVTSTTQGVTTTSYTPVLPWTSVTHWFYSSYLTQNLPPSEGEIAAQTANNEDVPSVLSDPAQAGGNIAGMPTYNAHPSPAVATTCPSTKTSHGVTTSNDTHQTTTYLTTGNDNCSLYITQSSTASSSVPAPSYTGSCFDPANTPGQAYAALSCQGYGANYYTFYWNDMGGAQSDNDNYGDGIVQISCNSASHVVLIE